MSAVGRSAGLVVAWNKTIFSKEDSWSGVHSASEVEEVE